MKKMRTYDELITLDTFEERLEYLYIGDKVCDETFGSNRWLNQRFYKSPEWIRTRDLVISRDNGCDLGVEGCDLYKKGILVHHINPITEYDILNRTAVLFDLNNLISTSKQSHNYIHYGIKSNELSIDRSPNDTCPWKK